MRMRLTVALVLAVLASAVFASSTASAFCRTTTCEPELESCATDDRGCVTSGVHLRWTKLPIVYRVAARGSTAFDRDEARARIATAFDAWTKAICAGGRRTSLTVVEGDAMAEDKPLGQKRGAEPFGIFFRDDTWPYASATTTLAITNQEYGKESGRIIYSDIEINTRKTPLTIFDLVVVHEAGHYLGLAHSRVPGSIMTAEYDNASLRVPNEDDLSGICELFPPDGLPEDDDGGCRVASADFQTEVEPPWFPLAIMALLPAVLRRHRTRARQR